ncbi:MAG: M14 family zinc carboxypeptidase [Bacillota bacterium]
MDRGCRPRDSRVQSRFTFSYRLGAGVLALLLIGLTWAQALAEAGTADPPVQRDPAVEKVVTFRLPSTAVLSRIQEMGIAVEAPVLQDAQGRLLIDLVVTDEQARQLAVLGLQPVGAAEGGPQGRGGGAGAGSSGSASPGSPTKTDAAPSRSAGAGTAPAAAAAAQDEPIRILRADGFENYAGPFVSVEARAAAGAQAVLDVYDAGSGEHLGTMTPFVDAGVYMYHTLLVPVASLPDAIRVTGADGAEARAAVEPWPSEEARFSFAGDYRTGFVDHYMDPTEIYARLEALAREFPDLTEIIELPYRTHGYRRQAMGVTGTTASRAIVWYSKAWGHEGGNGLRVLLEDPGEPNRPLTVRYEAATRTVHVSLATGPDGAVTSTAGQVIEAVNADPDLPVQAFPYRTAEPSGIVAPEGPVVLSDYLRAPDHVSRDPFTVKVLRIGKRRDGSRTGVFIYAQEHAREWVTPLVALETAARLLYNYRTHKPTRELVDNLDIFILPSVNPDGGHYSFYDYNLQRKNLVNHGGPAYKDPALRNQWGVDLNRNFAVGSVHDGYVGGSTNPLSSTYAGPAPLSEPEARNEVWLVENFPNIKFAMNVHSHGGYFMWPPGAYKVPGRIPLPRPTLGEETFFWQAGERILDAIERWRDTVILPGQTGPVIDVLYSAAGNSADHFWYRHRVFGWDFEVGAYRFEGGRWRSQGFQPAWPEAFEQAMEFANGTMELLRVALDYQNDRQLPRSWVEIIPEEGTRSAAGALGEGDRQEVRFEEDGDQTLVFTGPVRLRFHTSEPADVYYTLDGTRPTLESTRYEAAGVRDRPADLRIDRTTDVSFFAVDVKGLVEKNYQPDGRGRNYNRLRIVIEDPAEGRGPAGVGKEGQMAGAGR